MLAAAASAQVSAAAIAVCNMKITYPYMVCVLRCLKLNLTRSKDDVSEVLVRSLDTP